MSRVLQAIEIETRTGADGSITPLRVFWQGSWATIGQISRTWTDADGAHWLVMLTHPEKVLDIIRNPDGQWMAFDSAARFLA